MLVPVLLFIVGLVLLIKGGDWFVDGATGLAHRFHIPEILIGATVVSIGTTLPEVMVSATSAVAGHGEIAYGNAIGSIICNTSLIAALTVAIRPAKINRKPLSLPVIFFYVAAIVYSIVAYTTGYFSRTVGIGLVGLFVLYMVISVVEALKNAKGTQEEEEEEAPKNSLGKEIVFCSSVRRSSPSAHGCWWITGLSSQNSSVCPNPSSPSPSWHWVPLFPNLSPPSHPF